MKKKLFAVLKLLLPFLAIAISVLIYYTVSDNGKQKKTDHPYYLFLLYAIGAVILIEILIGVFNKDIKKRILHKAPFLTGNQYCWLLPWLATTLRRQSCFPLRALSLSVLVLPPLFLRLSPVLCAQSYPILCDPKDYSPPGSSVSGTVRSRILQWLAIPFSRGT